MRTATLIALALVGCAEYQAEPYASITYRDEGFHNPAGVTTDYEGPSLTVGVRYVPPTRVSHLPPLRVDTLPPIYQPSGPVTVNSGSEAPKGAVGEIGDLMTKARQPDGSYDPVSVGILALALAAFVALTIWISKKKT